MLIKKRASTGLRHFDGPKALIEYSTDIEEYNPNRYCKTMIRFDDMIADMLSNKKLNLIVTGLFIRGRKLNISPVFNTQSILFCGTKKY